MKKIIVIVLLIAGILLLVKGINTYQESSANVELLGLELSASDESGQRAAVLYLLLGAAAIAGSYFSWKRA